MIKILAACGAGVNSSHQIKSALEEELSNRGYDVHCDAVMVKDVNEDLMKGYDIFTPIAATDLLRNGWTCHHVNHFDSIGFTFWSEILQSA